MTRSRTTKTSGDTTQTSIFTNGSSTYIAKAPSFATTNSAMWQIKLIDDTSGNITLIKWASGTIFFDKIQDIYLTYTYF